MLMKMWLGYIIYIAVTTINFSCIQRIWQIELKFEIYISGVMMHHLNKKLHSGKSNHAPLNFIKSEGIYMTRQSKLLQSSDIWTHSVKYKAITFLWAENKCNFICETRFAMYCDVSII